MAQRLRGRATTAVAAGLAATCLATAAGPALADTVRNQEWWLSALHVTKAWLSTRGSGVTVAVLNTGVDAAQPDLAGSVTTGPDFTNSGRVPGGPFWGANGTAVASLIAGHGHGPQDAAGIIGIAPQARILSIRVTLEAGDPLLASTSTVAALPRDIARGINAAVRAGAQVIDLPLDPATLAGTSVPGGGPLERRAVRAALRKGVVLVAPAGDDGAGADAVNYPAAYPGVISVGAFDSTFTNAPFSSHQPYVTLTAPGVGVIAASEPSGYANLASTTAASAMVAGIAALIRAQFPALTPAQVEQALTSSTASHPPAAQRSGSGAGTVDAAAALVAAARIYATAQGAQASARPVTPTPPAAPKVAVHTPSLWHALRYPVLGIAAILLIAAVILMAVRVRQRRELDAQLAPLRAAAEGRRADREPGAADAGPVPATLRRAPFDDPAFVPPSFHERTFQDRALATPALGGPALASPAMSGPVLPNPVFGEPGRSGSGFSRPVAGRPPLVDPAFGAAGAGAPARDGGNGPAGAPFGSAPFASAPLSSAGAGPSFGGTPPFGNAPAGPPPFGTIPAGTPPFGNAPVGTPPFGNAPAGPPPFGTIPAGAPPFGTAAADAPAAEEAAATGSPFGRPAPGDPPAPPVRTLGATHRLNSARVPRTTGHPPWGPAEMPEGELPWMDAPARPPAGRLVPPRRAYPAAGEAGPAEPAGPPPAGPGNLPARRPAADPGPFPGLEAPSPAAPSGPPRDLFGPVQEPGSTPHRAFMWDTGDSTESFPAVGPADSQRS